VSSSSYYQILAKLPTGDPFPVETPTGLDEAKSRLIQLASTKPGDYAIYDLKSADLIEPFRKYA
jgi:hypothetical protein